mmetsp:Transcript_5397/g.18164  ORF Transcript_5397/g.18164 Transcript_5397/m.18164 type:complete len:258 (+) Transcript_5397:311-1084(+)
MGRRANALEKTDANGVRRFVANASGVRRSRVRRDDVCRNLCRNLDRGRTRESSDDHGSRESAIARGLDADHRRTRFLVNGFVIVDPASPDGVEEVSGSLDHRTHRDALAAAFLDTACTLGAWASSVWRRARRRAWASRRTAAGAAARTRRDVRATRRAERRTSRTKHASGRRCTHSPSDFAQCSLQAHCNLDEDLIHHCALTPERAERRLASRPGVEIQSIVAFAPRARAASCRDYSKSHAFHSAPSPRSRIIREYL